MGSGSSRACPRVTSARLGRSAAEADQLFRTDDTRATYDAVAKRYAQEIATELANKPFDREFLDRFAERVGGRGRVVELGCGPGHVAAYLSERGVDVSGLDLAPAMVEQARRLFPGIAFEIGDMLDLPFEARSLSGVVAFYSIIHFDDDQMLQAFCEMARVLRPGGEVALAFHVGDEQVHRDEWWDTPVNIDTRFLQPFEVSDLLTEADLITRWPEERKPYAPEVEFQSRRAYVTAIKLPPFELGNAGTELRRTLTQAVLDGAKTATAGLAAEHQPFTADPVPAPGDRWMMLGFDDEPQAIVETTEVRVVPAGEVDLQFARDEGEGFESVADWRAAHERFWSEHQISDETQIVCEYFRVIEKVSP